MKHILLIFCIFTLDNLSYAEEAAITSTSLQLFDKSRNRSIPVEIYVSAESKGKYEYKSRMVIINHAYTVKNTEYSFIADALAKQGYFVVSIQHDLKNDPELPYTGDIFQTRKPIWERGVRNILFTLEELKKIEPHLDMEKVILIGHSNGGDISMLFTDVYPRLVAKAISLDSLRYPLPVHKGVPILSLRSNSRKADNGVLPKTGATIIDIKDAKHIDMCDRAPESVKRKIVDLITKFVSGKNEN